MFVSELDRSIRFYQDLLQVTASQVTSSAALLAGQDGDQLYLRALGDRAPHPQGGLGIQYLIWTAADAADLDRCEVLLKTMSAQVTRRQVESFALVEGVGPDHVPILVAFPGPDGVTRTEIIPRIYGW